MLGLLIKDEILWHDRWSSELGTHLKTKDSTFNIIIFDPRYCKEDILALIGDAPEDIYQIYDLEEEVPEEGCDFLADSGICYRRLH